MIGQTPPALIKDENHTAPVTLWLEVLSTLPEVNQISLIQKSVSRNRSTYMTNLFLTEVQK